MSAETGRSWSTADFDVLSWHDCPLWGFEMRIDCPDGGDWQSDIVFKIDFITEWMCGADRQCSFMIAPAELVFHNVTGLKIGIDWGDSHYQSVPNEIDITQITREWIADPLVRHDEPYAIWRIKSGWPASGEISFGATGFTQTLLAEPVHSEQQSLTLAQRRTMIRGTACGR